MPIIFGSRLRAVVFGVLAVAGFAALAPALGAQQSLADVAKKEEERRKATPKPQKVYTNKDLSGTVTEPPTPATPPAPGTAAPDPAKDPKDAGKEPKDNGDIKDQAYWAGRIKQLTDKLARDTNFADAMQTRVNTLTGDLASRDDPAQRGKVQADRQKSIAELARLKQDIAAGKKAIADLQEEARRLGVPPGWLR